MIYDNISEFFLKRVKFDVQEPFVMAKTLLNGFKNGKKISTTFPSCEE